MEKHLPLQFVGPYKGYRVVNTKTGLLFAAKFFSSAESPTSKITKLKISRNLGATDGSLLMSSTANILPELFYALAKSEYLEVLDLSDCGIDDDVMLKHVVKMIANNRSIVELRLARNNFTAKALKSLFLKLGSRSKGGQSDLFKLKVLDLEANLQLDDEFGNSVASEDLGFSVWNLEKISIKGCSNIGAPGIQKMLKNIGKVNESSLKTLDLSGANISDDGALEIATSLIRPLTASLSDLLLSDCGISEFGIKKLCDALKKGDTVRKLDISKNHIGDGSLPELAKLVEDSSALTELNMKQGSFSIAGMNTFLDKLWNAYENFGTSNLKVLNLSKNGLGDACVASLVKVLGHCNCAITTIKYDQNDLGCTGAKKWAEFLKTQKSRKRSDLSETWHNNWLQTLTLKGNNITDDGIKAISEAITANNTGKLRKLDVRDNKMVKYGAYYLYRMLLGKQKSMAAESNAYEDTSQFVLCVFPKDIGGVKGINKLMVAARSGALSSVMEHSQAGAGETRIVESDKFLLRRAYFNPAMLQAVINHYDELERVAYDKVVKDRKGGINTPRLGHTWYQQFQGPYLLAYPHYSLQKRDMDFVVEGWNETMTDDCLQKLYIEPVYLNDRKELVWRPQIWGIVKQGYSSPVTNYLYRLAFILRCEDARTGSTAPPTERALPFARPKQRVSELRKFWNVLVTQRSMASEGLTMFEFLLKYNQGRSIDIVRIFSLLYPGSPGNNRVANPKDFFVFARLGSGPSSKLVREICEADEDPHVRRWAASKKLVGGRYDIINAVYKSKSVWICMAEDLFHPHELDEDRYYYVRTYPKAATVEDEKLMDEKVLAMKQREVATYESFENEAGISLETNDASGRKLPDIIHLRLNGETAANHYHVHVPTMAGDGVHKHGNDVVVWEPYVKTLRQALDEEALAGGANMNRLRHVAICVSRALLAFNKREWWLDWDKMDDKREYLAADKSNRIHGNLKPRNIVMSSLGDVMDSIGSEEFEKWVLIDFTRSCVHETEVETSLFEDSAYMPPEIARRRFTYDVDVVKSVTVTEKIDSWAFGCVLFEMCAGVPLFQIEQREDSLLLKKERAELVNWIRLDEDRKAMILSQLPDPTSEESKKLKELATNLICWCLQGDPKARPDMKEIRFHPFLKYHTKQQTSEPTPFVLQTKETLAKEHRLLDQPHVHVINSAFEEAHAVVQALRKSLGALGCRLTTDDVNTSNTIETIHNNCLTARVVVCMLSKDCFFDPLVINQLVMAHKTYLDIAKSSSLTASGDVKGVTFMNILNNKGPRKWVAAEFTSLTKWFTNEKLTHLCKYLSTDKRSERIIKTEDANTTDRSEAIRVELRSYYHPMICSMLRETLQYRPQPFLQKKIVAKLLAQGNLQSCSSIKPFEAPRLKPTNFAFAESNIKMWKYTDKKAAFFMPEKVKTAYYPHRVIVLEPGISNEFVSEAVMEITAGLQSFVVITYDTQARDKKYNIYRDRVNTNPFTKVLNTNRVKKGTSSHFPAAPRISTLGKAYNKLFAESVSEGKLVVVAIIDEGFTKKYAALLEEFEQRRQQDLVIVPVYLSMSKTWEPEYEVLMKTLSPLLRLKLQDKSVYIPYFKKNDSTEHRACLEHIGTVARSLTLVKTTGSPKSSTVIAGKNGVATIVSK